MNRDRPPFLHRRTASFLIPCLLLDACGAGWRQPPSGVPQPLPPRQQVQVWQAGQVQRWHGVRVSSDSVTGIPYFMSLECDSCRLSVPRARVDSLRLGDPEAGFWKTVGLVIGLPLLFVIISCRNGGCAPD